MLFSDVFSSIQSRSPRRNPSSVTLLDTVLTLESLLGHNVVHFLPVSPTFAHALRQRAPGFGQIAEATLALSYSDQIANHTPSSQLATRRHRDSQ